MIMLFNKNIYFSIFIILPGLEISSFILVQVVTYNSFCFKLLKKIIMLKFCSFICLSFLMFFFACKPIQKCDDKQSYKPKFYDSKRLKGLLSERNQLCNQKNILKIDTSNYRKKIHTLP